MKKGMKKLFILMFMALVLPINSVFAAGDMALLVGEKYSGIDTTVDVGNANQSLQLIKTIQKSTDPTISWMKGSNGSVKRMESDIIFFSGHGNSSLMAFEEFTISAGSNSSTNVGLSSYNMKNVSLAVFAGCKTGEGNSNITKSANSMGATSSLGWKVSIGATSHTSWLKYFWQAVGSNQTLNSALSSADSHTYADEGVKNYSKYGNWARTIEGLPLLSLQNNFSNTIEDADNRHIEIYKKGISNNSNYLDEQINNYIKRDFNDSFDIYNFEKKVYERDDKTIIDYILLMGDVRTNLGYTIFVQDNSITIFDNTDSFFEQNSNKINSIYNVETINFDVDSEIARARSLIDMDKYDIESQESYKYYDNDLKSTYFVVRSVLIDKVNKTEFVKIYKTELTNNF